MGKGARPRKAVWCCLASTERTPRVNHPGAAKNRTKGPGRLTDKNATRRSRQRRRVRSRFFHSSGRGHKAVRQVNGQPRVKVLQLLGGCLPGVLLVAPQVGEESPHPLLVDRKR